jgi:uncharacterized membrane protein YbjE (DUF340 family)
MIASYITSGIALMGLVIGVINRHKIQQVHVLVNSNLTAVMEKLGIEQNKNSDLKDQLHDAKGTGEE